MLIRIGYTLLFLVTMAQVISSLKPDHSAVRHNSVMPYRVTKKNSGTGKNGGRKTSTVAKPKEREPSPKTSEKPTEPSGDIVYVRFETGREYHPTREGDHTQAVPEPEDKAIVYELHHILSDARRALLDAHGVIFWIEGSEGCGSNPGPHSDFECRILFANLWTIILDANAEPALAHLVIWHRIDHDIYNKYHYSNLREHARLHYPRPLGEGERVQSTK
ncbi:hypothetical protein F5880DRAFT_1544667 [Lentinula raphanica]|nr:hypothetical protein F5880DRAFT_1544667 [Lentinula raphanica]